jgi:SAM-dependent methyltransferase
LELIPLIRVLRRWLRRLLVYAGFRGSQRYWEHRYASGGTSGAGSFDKLAEFKAEVLNNFVKTHAILHVLEFGCGDGRQLELADYPGYVGFDVSETAVDLCRKRFASDPSKRFALIEEYTGEKAPLTLSVDVIYHLVEDRVFVDYMARLFGASERFVIIYSSNEARFERDAPHVRHRHFTKWIDALQPLWVLVKHIPNRYPLESDKEGSFADFYIYKKGG